MRYKYNILARERTYFWTGSSIYVQRLRSRADDEVSVCVVTAFISRKLISGLVVDDARDTIKELANEV